MDTRLCTINVRGLVNKTKRDQIFQWLKVHKYEIRLLQETHLTSSNETIWKNEWKGPCYFSGNSSNKAGVCILVDPNLNCNIIQHTDIVPGRLQALEISINEKKVIILNLYGPNTDDITVFNNLLTYLNNNSDKSFIIGGDFNTVMDCAIDKKNGRQDTHKNCRNKINDITETHNLIDIWRVHHPNKSQYTWHSNTKPIIFSRLDYFLISDNLSNYTLSCNIKSSYKSDHSLVEISLDFIQQERGRGYFKLNNSLLLENDYQIAIRKGILDTVEINKEANPNTLWEIIKGSIRNETIKFSTIKKKKQNIEEQKYLTDINKIEIQIGNTLNSNMLETLTKELNIKKKQLEEIIDSKINGMVIRSKSQYVEHNEKNTKYFSNMEKKQSDKKIIKTLKHDGKTITKIKDIMDLQSNFYKNLYKKRETGNLNFNFFNDSINKINEEEKK